MLRSLLVSVSLLLAPPLAAAEPSSGLTSLTYSGDQTALDALDRDLSAAGTDAAKLASLETRLLQLLRRRDLTFTARQAISQRLGAVLAQSAPKSGADAYKPLGAMLAEDRESDLARLALDPAPGATVDALFVAALEKTTGRTRLGIIDSLARRRAPTAVPPLTTLLKDSDTVTADAAARALGEIANPPAAAALHALSEPTSPAIATAKLAAATRVPRVAALMLVRDLEKSARDPVHRAAAFRIALEIETATAAPRFVEALSGRDWSRKQVALEALAMSRTPDLVPTLLGKLNTWDAPTQSGVITALARRGEASAAPAFVTAASHPDVEVRTAAIEALGVLPGNRETAALLAKIAAGPAADEAKIARQSLSRLNGPEVSATILAGAERGDAALRAVYLEQLASRHMTEALPVLLKTRHDSDPAVRLAAIGALGDLAPFSQQNALLQWTIAATDEAEQARALRSLVNVTLRNPSIADRGRAIYGAIEQGTPDVALRLLPALQRIGGRESAASATTLALRDDLKLAETAVATLARWSDSSALSAFAAIASQTRSESIRTAAVEGALGFLEKNRAPWTPETTTVVSGLLDGVRPPATEAAEMRKRLVALLARANDQPSLSLAEKLQKEPALVDDARYAAAVIRANLKGKPKVRASTAASVSNILDGKTGTRWSVPALGEEWVEVDFLASRPLRRLTLDQTGRAAEFPERYEVFVTADLKAPGAAVASGAGQRGNKTTIELPAGTKGRYVIIKNTEERKDTPWAICELYVD